MAEKTILELAADVREKRAEFERTCEQIRFEQGDWTLHSMAGSEAERIANDGLRNAWTMLDRLNRLAKSELKAANEKVQATGGALSARSPATTGCASVTTER